MEWQPIFEQALSYKRFLAEYGGSMHTGRWRGMYDSVRLGEAQRALLAGFTRQMNVLCLAGAWCGDCVNQCPILQRFAEAAPVIDLRFLDRDVRPEIREELSINGGQRVPVVVFCSEDWFECGRFGDRPLSVYRRMAQTQLGAACPTGISDGSGGLEEVAQEWLNEFERVQLILRLSSRLRQMHAD